MADSLNVLRHEAFSLNVICFLGIGRTPEADIARFAVVSDTLLRSDIGMLFLISYTDDRLSEYMLDIVREVISQT